MLFGIVALGAFYTIFSSIPGLSPMAPVEFDPFGLAMKGAVLFLIPFFYAMGLWGEAPVEQY